MIDCRRIGSCDTNEELKKPGWAQTVDGEWVTVINTHEYPQEVKTTQCRNLGTSCSLSYTSSKTSCQQKFTDRRYAQNSRLGSRLHVPIFMFQIDGCRS